MIHVLVNGEERESVPITDRGFQYGDGVFETLGVLHGQPLLWDAHLQRLVSGCRSLGFRNPPPVQALTEEAYRLAAPLDRAVLKIIITRGGGPRGYRAAGDLVPTRVVSVDEWPGEHIEKRRRGARIRMCRTLLASQPRLAGLKHLNRLEQILARAEWGQDWDEGLMCGERGTVVEATASNLFAVIDGAIHTPDLTRCGVAGIMRDEVIRIARRLQYDVNIVDLPVDRLYAAQELFLTNSIIGIWPVRVLDSHTFGDGPVTRSLWRALNEQPQPVVVD